MKSTSSSGRMPALILAAFTCDVLACMMGASQAASLKPLLPLKDLDPIDACLFVCDMCFKVNNFYSFIFSLSFYVEQDHERCTDGWCLLNVMALGL